MSRLWAVTSYFNPAGYHRKLPNYRTFRKQLAVPLLAVELSHSDKFELEPNDADVLVQLNGGNVMWQKERLLNVGISHLPNDATMSPGSIAISSSTVLTGPRRLRESYSG